MSSTPGDRDTINPMLQPTAAEQKNNRHNKEGKKAHQDMSFGS